MEREKIYVNSDNMAVIECPHCGNALTQHVGGFKGRKRNVKVKCRCQSVFHVSFEFRKARRKGTNLQGFYAKLPAGNDWIKMVVISISLAGIRFLAHTAHNLRVGDEIIVRFNLSNEARTKVEKDAVVRWVSDEKVGCAFTEPIGYNDLYDTALSFHMP